MSEEEYETALKESSKKGVRIVLERDLNESMINNYNSEWLRAWNGNLDVQICLDFFSVITYITEYYCKDDTGTTTFLLEAAKNSKNLPQEKQRRLLKDVFLTHREMGIFEAYMKIFPNMQMKNSNIGVEFVPLGKPEDVSRYLVRANEEFIYPNKELFEVEGREGLYYEKPNTVEKYLRRSNDVQDLCLAQFVKMYDSVKSLKDSDHENEEELIDNTDENLPENNQSSDVEHYNYEENVKLYGSEAKLHVLILPDGELGKPLPASIKLKDPIPNEPPFMKKRGTPKALRFYKAKNDPNAVRFYLHELMLYCSFDRDRFSRWCESDETITKDYLENRESMNIVKSKVMEWLENVEEARMHVEESLKDQVDLSEVGEEIDAEEIQEGLDCEEEGIEDDPQYHHLNPEGLLDKSDVHSGSRLCKQLDLEDYQKLEEKTMQLDTDQMTVLEKAVNFARDTIKSSKPPNLSPVAPKLVVIGGAGAGKSTVIEVVSQWVHRILQKSGDDPESPYVIKTATTGAAATIIGGITLHSAMGFDFSNKHTSLSDKKRELRRTQLKNTKIVIVDEFSMLKSDLLYRLNLGLREIKQDNRDFGHCMLILLGDPLQLKPVRGRYIFERPSSTEYSEAFGDGTDSLWSCFEVINLTHNHRQDSDKEFANILNRIRVGEQTSEDIELLNTRVRPENQHLDESVRLYATVKEVNEYNAVKMNDLPGRAYNLKATHISKSFGSFKPLLKKDGRIGDTQFLDILSLKVGSRVMLVYNIDVSDGLANGATGSLIAVVEHTDGSVKSLIVKFDHTITGADSREHYPAVSAKYPEGTVIRRKEIEYSMARTKSLVSATAKLVQFPLIPAFAVTGHRFQGQTVTTPKKIVVDLRNVFQAAMSYVMLSRVQSINQLYILESLPARKIYADPKALEEVNRMVKVSVNENPSIWNQKDQNYVKLCFLNVRSIKNKFNMVKADKNLQLADVIFLCETWLDEESNSSMICLPKYKEHFNCVGRGGGTAVFFKANFSHEDDFCSDRINVSKLTSSNLDVLCVYRSSNGNQEVLVEYINSVINLDKNTVIGGDLNLDYQKDQDNTVTRHLLSLGFKQVVAKATHIQGGLIDHIYVRLLSPGSFYSVELFAKTYTDHDSVHISLKLQ